jgi:hypothetical protein
MFSIFFSNNFYGYDRMVEGAASDLGFVVMSQVGSVETPRATSRLKGGGGLKGGKSGRFWVDGLINHDMPGSGRGGGRDMRRRG